MSEKFKSAYSRGVRVYHPLSGEPTRVKQEFKKDVDINEIVARMKRGISPPPWLTSNTPRYGDFVDLPASFQEAHEILRRGEAAFKSLPLEFRRELDHDPRNLDKAPRELFERFGLLKKSGSPESPYGDEEVTDVQWVQGDRDLPVKRRLGANKGAVKAQAEQAEEA